MNPKSKARVLQPAKPAAATSAPRPLTLAQRVEAANRWRETYNPLRGLTIRRAVELSEAYFRGQMADLQWTYFFIEQTDPDLTALLELSFGRLLEMDWNILTPEDADEKLATEQEAWLRERYDAIDNLYDMFEHMGLARFRGFGHCEKWLGADGEISHLEIVDQWNVERDGLRGAWKYNPTGRTTNFRALPAEALMPPEQFLFRQVARPVNRFALLKFVRSNLSEKDWDAFNEIYGIPGGVVIGPPNVPEGQAAVYEDAGKKVSEGGTGYLPNGSDWKANTAARGMQPFKERLDHLTEKLVLAGTGGKLTMLTDATGLGSGASDTHGEVFDIIASAEARRISEICNKQLSKAWLEAKFPGQPALAYLALAANEETDTSKIVGDIKLLSDAGYQVKVSEVTEKTGYTVELKAAPPAPPAVPGSPAEDLAKTGSESDNPKPETQNPESAVAEPDPKKAAIANRATVAAGVEERFLAASAAELTAAEKADFQPLLDRAAPLHASMVRLAGETDDAAFAAELARLQPELLRFRQDLPSLEKQILTTHPNLEAAFSNVVGTALRSGLEEAAAARKPDFAATGKSRPGTHKGAGSKPQGREPAS